MDATVSPSRANPDPRRDTKRRLLRTEKPLSVNEVRILALLRTGPQEATAMGIAAGIKRTSVHVVLSRLNEKGLIRRQAAGWYELVPPKPIGAAAIAAVSEEPFIRPIPEWRRRAGR